MQRAGAVRPRRQREGTSVRPELQQVATTLALEAEADGGRSSDVGACAFYARPQEAERYTKVAKDTRVQHELASECLALLRLTERGALLLDVGCGGGLSSECVVQEGHFCVACDVNPEMIAQNSPERSAAGAVAIDMFASDMRDGVAARRGMFDGVISVSALQWICSDLVGLQRFFAGLHRSLRAGARACLQFYPTREQARLAVSVARSAGFGRSGCDLVLSMPHATRARKHFLVLTKASSSDAAKEQQASRDHRAAHDRALSRSCGCPIAWPIDGSTCKLAWTAQQDAADDGACAAQQRLAKDHVQYIARLTRQLQAQQQQQRQQQHEEEGGRKHSRKRKRQRKHMEHTALATAADTLRSGKDADLTYSYQRRALIEVQALLRPSSKQSWPQQQEQEQQKQKQKNPHLSLAFDRIHSLSSPEIIAIIDEELRYASSLPCFKMATTLLHDTASSAETIARSAENAMDRQISSAQNGMRRCEVCNSLVRVGSRWPKQWEQHLNGRRHAIAEARAAAAAQANALAVAQKKQDLKEALINAKAKAKAKVKAR